MHWTEPATSDDSHAALEKTLWDAANQLWAGAALKPSEYSPTVLGLIFLRYADVRFASVEKDLKPQAGSRRKIGPTDYHAAGVVYLPDEARFSHLLSLPEGANVGQAVNEAMRAIEKENPDLADVLPKSYHILESRTLASLLKTMASIPMDKGGDTFGLIYEYFLGKFAMSEGQKGGEFYTPTSIVKLIVEILEPYHGRILDPACGSGGMFIQSARFVEAHQKNPTAEISVHGQERVTDTARLARLNLAVHGLSGDIKQGNTYYEDLQDSVGRFDFVLANPPFNVSKIDKERLAGDPRYPFGIPRTDNGNYLWIQHFHSALNKKGRAGFVMANSAADARASEQEIREKIIRAGHVDVMVAIGPNFFFTVTLPCTLWFFDKGKSGTDRADKVLFLDARYIFRQLDRAHRDFTDAQLGFIANLVRLYRGDSDEVVTWVANKIYAALSLTTDLSTGDAMESPLRLIDELGKKSLQFDGHEKVIKAVRDLACGIENQLGMAMEHWNTCDSSVAGLMDYNTNILAGFSAELGNLSSDFDIKAGKIKIPIGIHDMLVCLNGALAKVQSLAEEVDRTLMCFPELLYIDIPGLCKAATLQEIEAQGWSLNPGRYVGVAKGEDLSDEDFKEQLEALNEELEVLNAEARELEARIAENVTELLEA